MKNHSGFSLTELMVVLGMIVILSGLAYPNIRRWKEGISVKNFAYEFSSVAGSAVDYARSHGVRVIVAVSVSESQNWTGNSEIDPVIYLVFTDDNNKNGTYDNGERVLAYGTSSNIRVKTNEIGKSCFSRTGRCMVFFPVGPPNIGAVDRKVEFQSKIYNSIIYRVTFRSITGITEVASGN